MNTTIEIDKAGRVVIPKKVRDAMDLHAGDRLELEEREEGFFLRPEKGPHLVQIDGLWVMTGGPKRNYDVRKLIEESHAERERRILHGDDAE